MNQVPYLGSLIIRQTDLKPDLPSFLNTKPQRVIGISVILIIMQTMQSDCYIQHELVVISFSHGWYTFGAQGCNIKKQESSELLNLFMSRKKT